MPPQRLAPQEAFSASVTAVAFLAQVHGIHVVLERLEDFKRRRADGTLHDLARYNAAQHITCQRVLHERNEKDLLNSTQLKLINIKQHRTSVNLGAVNQHS